MRKLLVLAVLAVVALFLATGLGARHSADAGNGVVPKVTGGSEAQAGVLFSMTVNALEDSDGNFKGKIQYSRETQGSVLALKFHAKVECSNTFAGGTVATAVGPITNVQDDPGGQINLETANFAVVAVKEGPPDRVRVHFVSATKAGSACDTQETSFPGIVLDGNYTIRVP